MDGAPSSWVEWSAGRVLCCHGFLVFEGAATHGLSFPVGERAPDPLHGTKLEVAEPDGAEDEIAGPDAGYDGIELIVLKLAVEAESEAIEENGAADAGEEVVAERGLSDSGNAAREPLEEAGL